MLEDLEYIRWAHERYGLVRLDLASSGIPWVKAEALGAIAVDDPHAPRAFADAIAERYALGSPEVMPTLGTSQAIWLACAALLEPGDDVLVETPTYEPLHRVPAGLGATVRFFERPASKGWVVDPATVRSKLTERTRLVVLSSPHNPSGIPVDDETLASLARECSNVGAALLVDEVYGEFLPGPRGSARSAGPNVIAVSSLTKRWGLGWARAGWMAASPDIVARAAAAMRHGTGNNGSAHAAIGLAALEVIDELSARADAIVAGGAERVDEWVGAHDALSWSRPPAGPFGLVRVDGAEGLRERIEAMAAEHGVLVAPGEFFGAPGAFRIGWTASDEELAEGLEILGEQLLGAVASQK